MRYAILITIIFTFLIVCLSTSMEIAKSGAHGTAGRSVYHEDRSVSFLFDGDSSFYSTQYWRADPPYLPPQKIGHFYAYGFLTAVIFLLMPVKPLWLKGLLASTSASLTGLVDEIHQHFLINRGGNIYDVLINAAGSLAAVLLLMAIYTLFSSNRAPEKRK